MPKHKFATRQIPVPDGLRDILGNTINHCPELDALSTQVDDTILLDSCVAWFSMGWFLYLEAMEQGMPPDPDDIDHIECGMKKGRRLLKAKLKKLKGEPLLAMIVRNKKQPGNEDLWFLVFFFGTAKEVYAALKHS